MTHPASGVRARGLPAASVVLAVVTLSTPGLAQQPAAAPPPTGAQAAAPVAPPPATPSEPEAAPSATPSAAEGPSTAQKKAGYALPYLLRPAIAANVVRVDAALAFQDKATTVASTLTAGYKLVPSLPDLALYAKVAVINQSPDAGGGGLGVSNPVVFGLFTPEVAPHLRLALFAGATAPIGSGGGNDASANARSIPASGVYARQAMDNALFAVNFFTVTAGAGVAYVKDGLTLQAEATILQLARVRGDLVEKDDARTNMTTGLHAGYLIANLVTASAELHYQRWLSTPAAVTANDALRDQATAGLGVRLNLPLSDTALARPGLAYFHPIDDPMAKAGYRVVQLDVPIVF